MLNPTLYDKVLKPTYDKDRETANVAATMVSQLRGKRGAENLADVVKAGQDTNAMKLDRPTFVPKVIIMGDDNATRMVEQSKRIDATRSIAPSAPPSKPDAIRASHRAAQMIAAEPEASNEMLSTTSMQVCS